MDFFKSLILDTDEQNVDEDPHPSAPNSDSNEEDDHPSDDDGDQLEDDDNTNLWSFGGLLETITTRSESVFETYRRDLQEFGTGLKKETEMIREAASKAVKDLPASIDVAHGAIDGVFKSISHAAASDEFEGDSKAKTPEMSRDSVRFSRFETQLNAIQNDVNTFREEPEDLEEFGRWKSGFALIDRGEEIAGLIGEKGALEGVYKGMVPGEVDNETFWFRYFYRVHKLQQQESVRANLVKRAISIDVDDEEELSWDVDDDDDDDDDDGVDDKQNVGESSVVKEKGDDLVDKKVSSDQDANVVEKEGDRKDESLSQRADNVGENKSTSNVENASKKNAAELKLGDESEVKGEERLGKVESEVKNEEKVVKLEENSDVKKENSEVKKDNSEVKKDEKVEKSEEKESLKGKGDEGELGKETDVSAKPIQQSKVEEEDLEWDEIEDVDSNDEKKAPSPVEKSDKADLRKRLSTADDDEDLSWDIEDDD